MRRTGEIFNVIASVVTTLALLALLGLFAYVVLVQPACPPAPTVDDWLPPPPEQPMPGRTRLQ